MNGQKFSLSFSKRIEKKSLQPSALGRDVRGEVRGAAQALLAVDQDSLKVNENVEEEELVIPLLQAKRSTMLSRLAKLQKEDEGKETEETEPSQETVEDSKTLTLEEKAERALLEESRMRQDEGTGRKGKDITIPAATIDDPLAAPLVDIGKESSLDDYDEIGVESFGAAILRGMGWKKSEGVGGRGKKVVEIIDPASKTLGSSERKEAAETKEGGEEGEKEEELPVVKGSCVFLHSGRHRGTYGVVEVVDEDHLLVRAAMGQAVLREVEGNLRVATQKEYKESSRVINKEMYDKFKEAEIKKKEEKKGRREEEEEDSGSDKGRKSSQKTKNRDREESSRETSSRETVQRNADSENAKVKQWSGEEEKIKKVRERDSERQKGKDERLRDETEESLRGKNSEKQRERDNERHRDRDDEGQRDKDEEKHRRHRDKKAERQRDKESKQEYTREERKERSEHPEYDRRTQDPHTRPHKDSQAPGVKRKQEETLEAQNKMKTKQQKANVPPWVRENLRVRIINKNYKGGKYHKAKVVVMNVVTAESCECVAEGGRPIKGVDPAWLETVIPKQQPMVVMVVRGPHTGQKGRILQLHKDQEKASIQLLEDETSILKLHYDDICEYVLR
ncbi:G-patch domain and KOW motifs-containing protein [Chionoecetes opilio]|uniref:G-patch domain and KOW motifs-containing protein n=1 Tax=Chionoecetes opilio TaxID=41210 RepID=A0A8J4Y4J9_CHIOP|nr:G-patch domain and KOW motifs-containing protein [Chionoecetes opilio]KAG0720427.1 G-patch domain and KOW motifs-containing protein [Chionoecetes opilio]